MREVRTGQYTRGKGEQVSWSVVPATEESREVILKLVSDLVTQSCETKWLQASFGRPDWTQQLCLVVDGSAADFEEQFDGESFVERLGNVQYTSIRGEFVQLRPDLFSVL